MAEGVFRQMVNNAALADKISVDSAGTGDWHVGEEPHKGTLAIFCKHNIAYNGVARQLTHEDFARFDYIIAMDRSNLRTIRNQMPFDCNATIALLLDYAPTLSTRDVPDPYYDGRFDEVYDLVSAGCQGLLAAIRHSHQL
jgi:protein-tyrosine phosphatase